MPDRQTTAFFFLTNDTGNTAASSARPTTGQTHREGDREDARRRTHAAGGCSRWDQSLMFILMLIELAYEKQMRVAVEDQVKLLQKKNTSLLELSTSQKDELDSVRCAIQAMTASRDDLEARLREKLVHLH
jgi:hypothetical protein